MSEFQPVTHVLFDMDGLLLDSEKLYTLAISEIASRYGRIYTWEMKVSLMGKIGRESAIAIVDTLQLPITPDEYVQYSQEILTQTFSTCELMPDTERLYTLATEELAARHGKIFTWELKVKQMGLKSLDLATLIVTDLDLPITPHEYVAQVGASHLRLFPNSKILPGAERLIRHLKAKGIPIAVATSSSVENYELKTVNHKPFFAQFDQIVWGSSDPEVKNGKPSPDIFLVCASRFPDQPHPSQCLVFEDAPNGVRAAKAAGMQVVMVPDARMSEELRSEATLALNSLEEFRPELFGLPPYDD